MTRRLSMRKAWLWGLTLEVRRGQRQAARPGLAKMYRVPPDRAWWPAVGPRLDRRVRRRYGRTTATRCFGQLAALELALDDFIGLRAADAAEAWLDPGGPRTRAAHIQPTDRPARSTGARGALVP